MPTPPTGPWRLRPPLVPGRPEPAALAVPSPPPPPPPPSASPALLSLRLPLVLALRLPWLRAARFGGAGATSAGPVSPPPAPTLRHAGTDKTFIGRDPHADARTRSHTERVLLILNSLMRTGQLYETGQGEKAYWQIVVGPQQIEFPTNGTTTYTDTF